MVIIPKALPWKEALVNNFAYFVKDLSGTWAIGTFDLSGRECIIDFQDNVVPSFFKSENLAILVFENLDAIFTYLMYRGKPRVAKLAESLGRIFDRKDEIANCDPREYRTIHWNDVPKVDGWAPITAVEFSNHAWGIVANMPEDDYLVLFEPDDPVKTFHLTQAAASKAVDLLLAQCLEDFEVDERFQAVSTYHQPRSQEPLQLGPGRFYFSSDPVVLADVFTVMGIRDDWYNRRTGSGTHCFCRSCVSQAHAALARIESRHGGPLDWELTQAIKDARNWIPVR